MKVRVPILEHRLVEVLGADELGQPSSRPGKVPTVDRTKQILASDWHVLGIARAQIVVALVSAGTAFDARIQKDAERAGSLDELTHFANGSLVPILDQRAGKTERGLLGGLGPSRLARRSSAGRHCG